MKKGSALLLAIIMLSSLTIMGALLAKIVYNGFASVQAQFEREAAFYLAEAGLELGKVKLNQSPDWHSAGEETPLGPGSFKIAHEDEQTSLFSIGRAGKATVILKLEFSNTPFKVLAWQEI